jgi:hypothetical protein
VTSVLHAAFVTANNNRDKKQNIINQGGTWSLSSNTYPCPRQKQHAFAF